MVRNPRALEPALLVLASLTVVHAAPYPSFDYIFAANCPTCRSYGNSTLKELYAADGIANAINFTLEFAIRVGDDGKYQCVAEAPGCPITRYMQCAFDTQAATIISKMAYMTCWNKCPMLLAGTSEIDEQAVACAKEAAVDWNEMLLCNQSSRADELNEASYQVFKKRFPEFSHAGFGPFGVPHVYIDGEELGPKGWAEKVDFPTLLKKLCDKGIDAKACREEASSVIV
mmetsp:Transcript_70328/g.131562  ORF Transcript_70328/g.131562 Transcript_70328/m.131562 type:complete len:229 (+) Transcript_70328:73-759(+)